MTNTQRQNMNGASNVEWTGTHRLAKQGKSSSSLLYPHSGTNAKPTWPAPKDTANAKPDHRKKEKSRAKERYQRSQRYQDNDVKSKKIKDTIMGCSVLCTADDFHCIRKWPQELAGVCLFGLGFGDKYVASSIRCDCQSPTKRRDGPTYALANG
jgi:hypothetical protein